MQNPNRTTIKILGSINDVKETARKIEQLFPLFLESPIRTNDNSEGVHLFITLPAEKQNANSGLVRQDQARTATTPQLSFNLTEVNSK